MIFLVLRRGGERLLSGSWACSRGRWVILGTAWPRQGSEGTGCRGSGRRWEGVASFTFSSFSRGEVIAEVTMGVAWPAWSS